MGELDRALYLPGARDLHLQRTGTDGHLRVHLPARGRRERPGYVAYVTAENMDGCLLASWMNYTHQTSWRQHPALTAIEMRQGNSWNVAGGYSAPSRPRSSFTPMPTTLSHPYENSTMQQHRRGWHPSPAVLRCLTGSAWMERGCIFFER